MQYHLSIIDLNRIESILDGSKTIFYWFTKDRRAPYGRVNTGDIIYIQALEATGGKVRGKFTASNVEPFDNLTPAMIDDIYANYGQQMFGRCFSDPDFVRNDLNRLRNSKYGTFIHITQPCRFPNPQIRPFDKQSPRTTWIVLNDCQVIAMRNLEEC